MKRALVLSLALLSACEDAGDRRICSPHDNPPIVPATNFSEQSRITYRCVGAWASRLSGSRGSLTEIAKAAIGACRDAIGYSQDYGRQANIDMSAYEQHLFEHAMWRAAQSQAGKCPPP